MALQRVADLGLRQFTQRRDFRESPPAWEDEVFYFLLLDRFSDGKEAGYRGNDGEVVAGGSTQPFRPEDSGNAITTPEDAARWREAGGRWVGGDLRGLASKLKYLKRLGVSAIWVSPLLKQVSFQDTYHGYGIQNYLDVDRHFGTPEDLRDLVAQAHEQDIYVILDVILNHTGNVFGYDPDRYLTQNDLGEQYLDPRWDGRTYRVKGFRDSTGQPSIPFGPVDLSAHPAAWPDGAIWPAELQRPETFTQKGRITSWDYDPEFLEGDFEDLKDVHLGAGPLDDYRPSPALQAICKAYKYWIAYADLDGFRIDTVKHMDPGATRFFAAAIHEFAQSIGKERFFLLGEITGGRQRAYETLEVTGLDAALGIDDIPDKLEYLLKGRRNPSDYFDLFRNSLLVQKDSHVWFRDKVVTMYDDHDQVRKGQQKGRFCAGDPAFRRLALSALALNATTLGIPCIYYGSEQCFDGEGGNDRYIREAMFGGDFGAFRSRERHFFQEDGGVYRELAKILEIRRSRPALRRGRQYLRSISGDGEHFGLPRMLGDQIRSVVPWSRIFNEQELVLAINTDPDQSCTAWVTVDNDLHAAGDSLSCIYSTDDRQRGQQARVEVRNGRAISLSVPAGGFMIYE